MSTVSSALKHFWYSLPQPVQSLSKSAVVASTYFIPGGPLVQTAVAGPLFYQLFWKKRSLAAELKKPIVNLVNDVYTFKTQQPDGAFWRAPIQSDSSAPVPISKPNPIRESDLGITPTPALGANPKMEQIDVQARTDTNVKKLVANGANFTAIYFIHVNRLGYEDVDNSVLMKIVQESTQTDLTGNKPSLWSVYMKHLGANLSFFDKVRAYFWYLLSHSTGIIGNSINTFLRNVVAEFRSKLTKEDREIHMDSLMRRVVDQGSSFLDVYNGAMRSYAMAIQPTGKAKDYRTRAIETLHGTTFSKLCEQFSDTAVDQFFPKVPFFESVRQSKWFSWLYAPLHTIFGPPLNWVGRKIVKYLMPSTMEKMVRKGVATTDSSNLPFKTALTSTLTELFLELNKKSLDTLPIEPLPGTKDLPLLVEKLLNTLDLMSTDETQGALKEEFNRIDRKSHFNTKGLAHFLLKDEIHNGVVKATQAFVHQLIDEPQVTEKLFSDFLRLLNLAFQEGDPTDQYGAPIPPHKLLTTREDEYSQAHEALENASAAFFERIIDAGVVEKIQGVRNSDVLLKSAHQTQQQDATATFQQLASISNDMLSKVRSAAAPEAERNILIDLDHSVELLKKFSTHTQTIKLEWLPEPALQKFYASFHSIYLNAEDLIKKALLIQDDQVSYLNSDILASEFGGIKDQLRQMIDRLPHQLDASLSQFTEIQERIQKIGEKLPKDAPETAKMHNQIETLSEILKTALSKQKTLEQYQRLGGRGLLHELAEFVQGRQTEGFSRKRNSSEITEALSHLPSHAATELRPLIEQLQRFRPGGEENFDQLWRQIQESLVTNSDLVQQTFDSSVELARIHLNRFYQWTSIRHSFHLSSKEASGKSLLQKLTSWDRKVIDTQRLIRNASPRYSPPMGRYIPRRAIEAPAELLGLTEVVMQKFRSAYKLLTSRDIYEASVRSFMKEFIESYS